MRWKIFCVVHFNKLFGSIKVTIINCVALSRSRMKPQQNGGHKCEQVLTTGFRL